jgi:molybdenum cofactor cytidylyltransferase
VHAGQRGNPVLVARRLFPAIERLQGDEGARRILVAAKVMEVPVEGDEVAVDIDTPEGLSGVDR